MAELSHDAPDDGFHEIQLSGKQLVFLFMATTVVSVVIFLCGVLVGRSVARSIAADSCADAAAPPISAGAPASQRRRRHRPPTPPAPPRRTRAELSPSVSRRRREAKSLGRARREPAGREPRGARAARAAAPAPAHRGSAGRRAGAPKAGTWAVQVQGAARSRRRGTASSSVWRQGISGVRGAAAGWRPDPVVQDPGRPIQRPTKRNRSGPV